MRQIYSVVVAEIRGDAPAVTLVVAIEDEGGAEGEGFIAGKTLGSGAFFMVDEMESVRGQPRSPI